MTTPWDTTGPPAWPSSSPPARPSKTTSTTLAPIPWHVSSPRPRPHLNGIAAELGQLAGKTDKVSQAIRERLTTQFTQRDDDKTAIEAELQAITDAAPLPDSDLTLINELPHAPGLLAQAPDDLRERLAAAFGMQ